MLVCSLSMPIGRIATTAVFTPQSNPSSEPSRNTPFPVTNPQLNGAVGDFDHRGRPARTAYAGAAQVDTGPQPDSMHGRFRALSSGDLRNHSTAQKTFPVI